MTRLEFIRGTVATLAAATLPGSLAAKPSAPFKDIRPGAIYQCEGGVLGVIESGMIPQPVGETDAAYRTLVASHNRILELIREQANDALEYAGGKK